MEKYGGSREATEDSIIRRMRFACWITKTTDTRLEYEILIACPWQQLLSEGASWLRYTLRVLLLFSIDRIVEVPVFHVFHFSLQMHHPIQMKPADSENRNGE